MVSSYDSECVVAVLELALRVGGYQEGTMRSASESKPIAKERGAARQSKAKAVLAVMVERCNMQCNARCVAGVWASLIGSATVGER